MTLNIKFEMYPKKRLSYTLPRCVRNNLKLKTGDILLLNIGDKRTYGRVFVYKDGFIEFRLPQWFVKDIKNYKGKIEVIIENILHNKNREIVSKCFVSESNHVEKTKNFPEVIISNNKLKQLYKFKTKIGKCKTKGKFYNYFLIPSNLRNKLKRETIIIFSINKSKDKIVGRIGAQYKVFISTKIKFDFLKEILIKIYSIIDVKIALNRTKEMIVNCKGKDFIDILSILPKSFVTERGNNFLILVKEINNNLLIWFEPQKKNVSKPFPILIKRYIPVKDILRFNGLYYGDGSISEKYRVEITNGEKEIIKWIIKFMKKYFNLYNFTFRLCHGNKEIFVKNEDKIKKFWSKIGIRKFSTEFASHKKASKYGNMKVVVFNSALKLLVKKFLNITIKILNQNNEFVKYYLQGLIMSDAAPLLKHKRLECINFPFKLNKERTLKHYKRILDFYNVDAHIQKTKGMLMGLNVYNRKNYIKFLIDDILILHPLRYKRFLYGLWQLEDIRDYYKKLLLLDRPLSANEIAKRFGITIKDIYKNLKILIKMGLINYSDTYPKIYYITEIGKIFVNKIKFFINTINKSSRGITYV